MHTVTLLLLLAAQATAAQENGREASAVRAQDLSGPTIRVSPTGPVRTLAEALRRAPAGARIVVSGGTYVEPMVIVDQPVTIEGEGWPVFDGEGARQLVVVAADDVTIRGLVLRNVGSSYVEDRAAIRVVGARRCTIEGNRFENTFFGVYLAEATACRVANNTFAASGHSEAASGNGIHLWNATETVIEDNHIRGHRDGIYLEFSPGTLVRRNLSEGNLRYGLHFMYSDDCRYEANTFRRNLAGVAVMYARRITMVGNRFEENWGSASYGLLLKEIYDPYIEGNRFTGNTVGLLADGAVRITARGNAFTQNGWAIRLMGSTYGGVFERNDFVGNTFDVASNTRESQNRLIANHFDSYRGYDLDRDGVGDVPHRPVRLFSVLVEQNPPALILLRSFFVDLLDMAERVVPALTPEALRDDEPAMRRHLPAATVRGR
ncbi:MAG TPA: nitrous oxide reductase family maturation protein NosD [Gemmatimonadaceae bacterium]